MIRRARPEDAEPVVRVFRAARAEAMPWLPVLHTAEEDVGYFARLLGAEEAYVFELDGAVAGFAVVDDEELQHLYVTPEAQGRGIGSALFARATEARPDGFHFWVFRDNVGARGFYEGRGCRLVLKTDGADNEERMPDALYEWPAGLGDPLGRPAKASRVAGDGPLLAGRLVDRGRQLEL